METNSPTRGTSPGSATAPAAGPLSGVRVLDLTRVLAGPYATMLLADLGADVLKVERPGTGDDTRTWGPPWFEGQATYYLSTNRNKRSICLDMRDEDDLATLHSLASSCHVLIENFRPGTLDKYGLGYPQLAADLPHLVYCSITGFGASRGAHLSGYDLIVQAAGGLMSITGPPGSEGTKVGVALVDVITGLHAAVGIQAALRHRDATGEGQLVEVNLLSSLLSALTNQATAHVLTGQVPQAMGNNHPSIVPYQPLMTADRPLAIAAASDQQFRIFATAIGREDLTTDERYATNTARVAHRDTLIPELEDALAAGSADHWFKLLTERGLPCAPINDIKQAFQFADELGLEPLLSPARLGGGLNVPQVRNPITLSRTPPTYRRDPPVLDQGQQSAEWLP